MGIMNKLAVILSLLVILMLFIAPNTGSVLANIKVFADQDIQITTNPQYDRNPSIIRATDNTYWLFFARGRDTGGIRDVDGYNPDLDYYDIYYKTAASIPELVAAAETMIPLPPPDNAQRDISALQTTDGMIWVFTSTGLGAGTQRSIYYYTYDGSWHGPKEVPLTEYAAHINVVEDGGKLWVFFDIGYNLYLVSYNEATEVWSSPMTSVATNATLGKAFVDNGTFYVVWSFVDEVMGIWGSGIYLSTSTDGSAWVTTEDPIAKWDEAGATNWDPVLIKNKNLFRLYWAPDIGSGGQFLATTTSYDPTEGTSWSTPLKLTNSSYEDKSWWDFWPQSYIPNGDQYLFYTSERNAIGNDRIDGNIWLRSFVLTTYLPLLNK
jgi:hypothetical protein